MLQGPLPQFNDRNLWQIVVVIRPGSLMGREDELVEVLGLAREVARVEAPGRDGD
ncbi:MAG: hypothetical protein ACKVVP_19680 [Chloroflexota bacterium]